MPYPALDPTEMFPVERRAVVGGAVNKWFAAAAGHRILDLVDGTLQVRPAASNLFGVLIVQIAYVLSRCDEAAVCAGCKKPFQPKRPISRGIRQYCRSCRQAKVPQRDAARDWRRRVRDNKA